MFRSLIHGKKEPVETDPRGASISRLRQACLDPRVSRDELHARWSVLRSQRFAPCAELTLCLGVSGFLSAAPGPATEIYLKSRCIDAQQYSDFSTTLLESYVGLLTQSLKDRLEPEKSPQSLSPRERNQYEHALNTLPDVLLATRAA